MSAVASLGRIVMEQKPFNPCGPLISAKEIAEKYFDNSRTPRWVLRTVCPNNRRGYTSATVRWLEADVVDWIRSYQGRTSRGLGDGTGVNAHRIRQRAIVESGSTLVGCQSA